MIDEHIGDEPVAPVAPRIAVRAAEFDLPPGWPPHSRFTRGSRRGRSTARSTRGGRACSSRGGLATARGADRPDPCVAGSHARSGGARCRNGDRRVSRAVQGGYGDTPEPIDTTVARAVELLSPGHPEADDPVTTEDVREQAEGLAASEEELVLIAMFGTDAEELLRMIRARHSSGTVLIAEDADERGERIRVSSRSCRRAASARSRSKTRGCASPCDAPTSPPRSRALRSRRMAARRPRPSGAA